MRRVVVVFGALLSLLAIGGGLTLGWGWKRLHQPWGDGNVEKLVRIAPGSDARAILEQLEGEGLLESALLSRLYLVYYLGDPPLQAGEYEFGGAPSAVDVLAKLVRGKVQMRSVTILEGLTFEEIAGVLAAAGFGDLDQLLAEMSNPARITDLDTEATNLEGYLFPDTYSFAKGTSAATIVDKLVRTFRSRLTQVVADPRASDVRDLVTLASIVEKEAARDDERATIAGVYANRLRQGIALYADPTVIYALRLAGRWDGNIRRRDLKIDSPYNTYRYPGLPPGPIASPGLASLAAAAAPADVPYLYFVSRNDGSHAFARTLAEHNRNVEIWQRAYWRQKRTEEREANGLD